MAGRGEETKAFVEGCVAICVAEVAFFPAPVRCEAENLRCDCVKEAEARRRTSPSKLYFVRGRSRSVFWIIYLPSAILRLEREMIF